MRAIWKRLLAVGLTAVAAGGAIALSPPTEEPPLAVGRVVPPSPRTLADSPALPEAAVALEWSGPAQVIVNRPAEWTLTVRNASAHPAQHVTVQVRTPATVSGPQMRPAAKLVDGTHVWDLGTLDPHAAVPLHITLTPNDRGEIGCRAWVTFTGSSGMTATVKEPRLEATISGPAELRVGQKGKYRVHVTNTGDMPIENSSLVWSIPAGLTPAGWKDYRAGTPLTLGPTGRLDVGQSADAVCEFVANRTGQFALSVRAFSNFDGLDGGLYSAPASSSVTVHGIPALRMELIDLIDPVEKGEQTSYEIRVANTGSQSDENVIVTCPLPEQFRFVSASGPTGYTIQDLGTCTVVKFDPIRELAPKTDAVFRVTVRAAAVGDVRFKAHLTSRHLTTSVAKEESTRVYGE